MGEPNAGEKRAESEHLFDFIQLVFGFALLEGFEALFSAGKALLGDIHSRSAVSLLWHRYLDPTERAMLGPALDGGILGVALILSAVQYYVIVNRLKTVYLVPYGLVEFMFDMIAALWFFVAAKGLETLSGTSFLVYDKCWVLLMLLYVALAARMLLGAIRVAKLGTAPSQDESGASRAMSLTVGGVGWYWISVVVMIWGFAYAHLGVDVRSMAQVLIDGSIGMFAGLGLLAAVTIRSRSWRDIIKVDLVMLLPVVIATGAMVAVQIVVRRAAWGSTMLLHYRHVFPWSTVHLGVMVLFLGSIIFTRRRSQRTGIRS